jgi:hypothetical protein
MNKNLSYTRAWKQLPRVVQVMLLNVFKSTLQWFVDKSHKLTGIPFDRTDETSPTTIAGIGFSLPAFASGAMLGLKVKVNGEEITLTREIAAAWTLKVLQAMFNSPQGADEYGQAGHHGFFYHFLKAELGPTGAGRSVRWVEGNWKSELSSMDTALAMLGIRFVITFYDGQDEIEREVRRLGNLLFDRVEWKWLLDADGTIIHGWRPENKNEKEKGFIQRVYKGYSEAMLLYILALGAPEETRISRTSYDAYLENQKVVHYAGTPLLKVPGMPAFLFQYPQTFIPFSGIKDRLNRKSGLDYCQFAENMARAQYHHERKIRGATGNGLLNWGRSACDGNPATSGYGERGCPFIPGTKCFDDNTVAPTAAIGFLPFAPGLVIPTMRAWIADPRIFNHYGFIDAFNLRENWFDKDSLAIDQGPIALQTMNYMMGFIWEVMKGDIALIRGLLRAGFRGGWLEKQNLVSRRELLAAA